MERVKLTGLNPLLPKAVRVERVKLMGLNPLFPKAVRVERVKLVGHGFKSHSR